MTASSIQRTLMILTTGMALDLCGAAQAQVPGVPPPMIDGVWRNLHWPSQIDWFTYGPPERHGYKVYAPNPERAPIAAYASPRGLPVHVAPTSARIEVKAPANADVFIEEQKSEQAGPVRRFISPPLKRDRQYTYSIRAQWLDGQESRTVSRLVTFRAGDAITVDLMPVLTDRATARR